MALATHRNTDTGELIELDENWLERFPKDPYQLVTGEELDELEQKQRQADVDAIGAQPFDPGEETPESPAPEPAAASPAKRTDAQDTPAPDDDPRDARRF